MRLNEQEILQYLNLPSLPKKKWDGKSSFAKGVAIITHTDGTQSYAVATFNTDKDKEPRITKVFTLTQYTAVEDVFVVPDYMDTDVEKFDLPDEASRKAAQNLAQEAEALEKEDTQDEIELPKHEYFFPFITNDEEAQAYIRSYNRQEGIKKGRVPSTHENIILRLAAIYAAQNK